jgi:hypothetical protein
MTAGTDRADEAREHTRKRMVGLPLAALPHLAAPAEHTGHDNPIWSFPGFRVERTRSWGAISADVISRDPGVATWRSDRHRIVYALTDMPGAVRIGNRPAETIQLQRNSNRLAFRPAGLPVHSDVPSTVRLFRYCKVPARLTVSSATWCAEARRRWSRASMMIR